MEARSCYGYLIILRHKLLTSQNVGNVLFYPLVLFLYKIVSLNQTLVNCQDGWDFVLIIVFFLFLNNNETVILKTQKTLLFHIKHSKCKFIMQPSKFFYFKNILKLTTQEILGPRFCTPPKPTWASSWEPCQFFLWLALRYLLLQI